MRIETTIPNKPSFSTTLEKISKFVPVSIIETQAIPMDFITFTKKHIMVKVYPHTDKKYGYCIVLVPDGRMGEDQAQLLKYCRVNKFLTMSRNDDESFSCVIHWQEEGTSDFSERIKEKLTRDK